MNLYEPRSAKRIPKGNSDIQIYDRRNGQLPEEQQKLLSNELKDN